jgi:uncharacterized protein involved in tolerance to divalent cations
MKVQKKTDSPKPDKSSADTPTFRWNDEVVTEQEYNALVEDHIQWVAALENPIVEDEPAKRSKRK